MAKEDPKAVFKQLPRKKLENFRPCKRAEGETIADFAARSAVTAEEIAWAEAQPVTGVPSLRRLRAGLTQAGFHEIELKLDPDAAVLLFSVQVAAGVEADNSIELLRLWITIFRTAGFDLGFTELCVVAVNTKTAKVSGVALTAPLEQVAMYGAPAFEDD